MDILENILALTKQLYPTGRAFQYFRNSDTGKLHKGLAGVEQKAYSDSVLTLDSILPDNGNFTTNDATDWERRLGMIYSPLTLLSDRKLAIKRKMQHPGTIHARQHFLYLEGQLRAAGFNVYVYENRFLVSGNYITRPATFFTSVGLSEFQHGQLNHNQRQHGGGYGNKIANSIDENQDLYFDVGVNLRSTFFIGGSDINNPLTVFSDVPLVRKQEFRQLILKIKPVQTVGYLFINYI